MIYISFGIDVHNNFTALKKNRLMSLLILVKEKTNFHNILYYSRL